MKFFAVIYYNLLCTLRFAMGEARIYTDVPDWYVQDVASGPDNSIVVAMARTEVRRREAAPIGDFCGND